MAQGYLALLPAFAAYKEPGIIRCQVYILQGQPGKLCCSTSGVYQEGQQSRVAGWGLGGLCGPEEADYLFVGEDCEHLLLFTGQGYTFGDVCVHQAFHNGPME
jgi:hypothetical protein